MATYSILVTDVMKRPTGFTVSYALRDIGTTPTVNVSDGQFSVEFSTDTTLTTQQRRALLRKQVTDNFDYILAKAAQADVDWAAVQTALSGLRYP